MINAHDLCYDVPGTRLLDRVSIDVPGGEVLAVLGPNGAGKSTLLGCLSGDLRPQSGRVLLDGACITGINLRDLAMKRAVLSQSVPVSFPFNVAEIVAMGRAPYGGHLDTRTDEAIVMATLEQVDAGHLAERIFPTLSGGEQQRVHLARVLAQLWDSVEACLLLDEPTSSLDLKHQHHVLSLARSLALERGFSVCVILHDLALAARYADSVCLLKAGRVVASGPVADVLSRDNIENVFEIDAALALPQVA